MSNQFYICIGSQFGPTYQFLLQDDVVYYGFSTQNLVRSPERLPRLEYQPEADTIEDFWKTVYSIGVPSWEPEYLNPEVPDGPRWEISMEHDGSSHASRGTGAFPNNPNPAYSPEFIELIIAIRRLLDWMPFG